MSKYPRYVIHNKCHGGHAVEEVDGNTYCLGLLDLKYDGGCMPRNVRTVRG